MSKLIRTKTFFARALAIATVGVGLLVNGSVAAAMQRGDDEDGFEVLFDGSSLDNFRGYRTEEIGSGWSIEDDALKFDGSNGGDIITREEYADFDLRFEWRVSPGANSGVMYRVSLGDAATYISGPEYQILDDQAHPDARRSNTSAASLYGLYEPTDKELKPVGEWNTARIVLQGNRIEHWLNGQKVLEAEIDSEDWKQRIANSKFRDWPKFARNRAGHIAFQDHGDRVWYRNIRIKRLDEN